MCNDLAYAPRHLDGRASSPCRDQSGAAAVEFAIILPVLVMMLYMLFELGRGLWTYNVLHLSVEEAGRFAAANPTATATQIAAVAEGMASVLAVPPAFAVTTQAGPSSRLRYVSVTATHDFTLLFPLFRQADGTAPLTTVRMQALARMPVVD